MNNRAKRLARQIIVLIVALISWIHYVNINSKPTIIEKNIIVYREEDNSLNRMITIICEELDIKDKDIIYSHFLHESSNFRSRRSVENNNHAGLSVWDDKAEGQTFRSNTFFAAIYCYEIKNKWPNAIGSETIDEFVDGLQVTYKEKPYATDKNYRYWVKRRYKEIKEGAWGINEEAR